MKRIDVIRAISLFLSIIIASNCTVTNPEDAGFSDAEEEQEIVTVEAFFKTLSFAWGSDSKELLSNQIVEPSFLSEDLIQFQIGETAFAYCSSNGALISVVALTPVQDWGKYTSLFLEGYTYVGDLDENSKVYKKQKANTFSVINKLMVGDTEYCSVEFIPIDSDAYEEIPPVEIILYDYEIDGCYAYISGKVTGVSEPVEIVVEYGYLNNPDRRFTRTVNTSNEFRALTGRIDWSNDVYCLAYVTVDNICYKTDIVQLNANTAPCPEGAVDLGLSVYWASINVGAKSDYDYNGYYQWAGTKDLTGSKVTIGWGNCPYHDGTSSTTGWKKYNAYESYGVVDSKTVLDAADDVASVVLGDGWRTPTSSEWNELFSRCSMKWIFNGAYGITFTPKNSEFSNQHLFLPAAGYRGSQSVVLQGKECYYWASELGSPPYKAWQFSVDSKGLSLSYANRYIGCSVRAVRDKFVVGKQ